MGSPMVFQTAPPQPASKARITWSAQFEGGPDASQNGFGQRIPAKFVVRSATVFTLRTPVRVLLFPPLTPSFPPTPPPSVPPWRWRHACRQPRHPPLHAR